MWNTQKEIYFNTAWLPFQYPFPLFLTDGTLILIPGSNFLSWKTKQNKRHISQAALQPGRAMYLVLAQWREAEFVTSLIKASPPFCCRPAWNRNGSGDQEKAHVLSEFTIYCHMKKLPPNLEALDKYLLSHSFYGWEIKGKGSLWCILLVTQPKFGIIWERTTQELPQVWFPAAPPRQSHPNSCGLYSMTFLFHDLHVNVSGRREKKDNLAVILTYCTLN